MPYFDGHVSAFFWSRDATPQEHYNVEFGIYFISHVAENRPITYELSICD